MDIEVRAQGEDESGEAQMGVKAGMKPPMTMVTTVTTAKKATLVGVAATTSAGMILMSMAAALPVAQAFMSLNSSQL